MAKLNDKALQSVAAILRDNGVSSAWEIAEIAIRNYLSLTATAEPGEGGQFRQGEIAAYKQVAEVIDSLSDTPGALGHLSISIKAYLAARARSEATNGDKP